LRQGAQRGEDSGIERLADEVEAPARVANAAAGYLVGEDDAEPIGADGRRRRG
jgi:hypothetical protein